MHNIAEGRGAHMNDPVMTLQARPTQPMRNALKKFDFTDY